MISGRPGSEDDLNLIQLELNRHSTSELAPSQLAHQIETIAAASRALETALLRERNYSKQLREYVNQVIARMNYLQKQEQEATEKLKEAQSGREATGKQIQELSAELEKTKKELSQYRNAWGQILAREKHAQYILSRGEVSAKRIQELETALATLEKRVEAEKAGREKAEGHVATHRQELQTTLVRLHSSEARYNDMARELEAIHTLRKNHALELSRVEQVAREKLEAQFVREREQLLMEISKERDEMSRALAELERARFESGQSRDKLRRELEAKFSAEIQRWKAQAETQAQSHLAQLAQMEQSQAEREQASEAMRGELTKLESIIRSLGEESKTLRYELSQARAEVTTIEQSSRQAELDLLRAREEVSILQKQLTEERAKKSDHEAQLAAQSTAAQSSAVSAERARSEAMIQELTDFIQADRKQIQKLVEKLLEAWGSEDPALREALEAIRDACEVRTVRTEPSAAKLEIVSSGGSRLNC